MITFAGARAPLCPGKHGNHVAAGVLVLGCHDTTFTKSTLNAVLFLGVERKEVFGLIFGILLELSTHVPSDRKKCGLSKGNPAVSASAYRACSARFWYVQSLLRLGGGCGIINKLLSHQTKKEKSCSRSHDK